MAHGPAYRIVTPRLVLRCFEPRDAALVKAAIDASLDHLAAVPWIRNQPQSLEDKAALLRRFRGLFDLGQDCHYGIFAPDETYPASPAAPLAAFDVLGQRIL